MKIKYLLVMGDLGVSGLDQSSLPLSGNTGGCFSSTLQDAKGRRPVQYFTLKSVSVPVAA